MGKEIALIMSLKHYNMSDTTWFLPGNVDNSLAHIRLRNPDLRTAIDVLSTGNYPTFPNQLTVSYLCLQALIIVAIYPVGFNFPKQGLKNPQVPEHTSSSQTHASR